MDEREGKVDPNQEKFWTVIGLEKDDGRISHDRQELRAETALIHLRKGTLNDPFYIMEAVEMVGSAFSTFTPFFSAWTGPRGSDTYDNVVTARQKAVRMSKKQSKPFFVLEAREGIKAQLPFWVIPMAGEALTDDLPGESEIPVV